MIPGPLTIDETPLGYLSIPVIGRPIARRWVNKRLRQRSMRTHEESWASSGIDVRKIGELCALIQGRMNWSNALYFPCDIVASLLIESFAAMSIAELIMDLESRYSKSMEPALFSKSTTMEDFLLALPQ